MKIAIYIIVIVFLIVAVYFGLQKVEQNKDRMLLKPIPSTSSQP